MPPAPDDSPAYTTAAEPGSPLMVGVPAPAIPSEVKSSGPSSLASWSAAGSARGDPAGVGALTGLAITTIGDGAAPDVPPVEVANRRAQPPSSGARATSPSADRAAVRR